jgi:O-antigen biosynthesis protein
MAGRTGGLVKSGADNLSCSAAVLRKTAAADAMPCVSIVVPVYNRLDLTRACLDSVFATADPSFPFEVLVIDDHSTDGTAEYLTALAPRVRSFRNDARQCFGYNVNLAARLARGEYLCLLNNDTLVTSGWLSPLFAAASKDPAIGVVGNRHLTPGTNILNHAGMVFDADRRPVHLYVGQLAKFPPALVSREFQCVTGACWLVERQLFLDLGGFDLQFKNGYEDVDFCLRVRRHGRKVFYAADSVIYHHGQQSPGRSDNDVANALAFERKWGAHIICDLEDYLIRDGVVTKPAKVGRQQPVPAVAARSADIHFATPLDLPNAFSWVTVRLALACEDAGIAVSLREGRIGQTIDADDRSRLQKIMARPAGGRAQVRWAHYWQPHFDQELSGRINAELFVHNYR